jgi:hypothetical protein
MQAGAARTEIQQQMIKTLVAVAVETAGWVVSGGIPGIQT